MLKIFKTYWKARRLFVFPKINVHICKWKHSPCLPVWRHGNYIKLYKHYNDFNQAYDLHVSNYFRSSNGVIKSSRHKVPVRYWWKQPIRRKLRKLHLGWIPPIIELPIWLSFYYFSNDVIWKTKWSEIRFEYNPLLSIVIFGISFNIWLSCPIKGEYYNDDHYWECILNWVYRDSYNKSVGDDIVKFVKIMSRWTRYTKDGNNTYYTLQPEYLKGHYRSEYLEKIKNYRT